MIFVENESEEVKTQDQVMDSWQMVTHQGQETSACATTKVSERGDTTTAFSNLKTQKPRQIKSALNTIKRPKPVISAKVASASKEKINASRTDN